MTDTSGGEADSAAPPLISLSFERQASKTHPA
eukprot:CAMPEP_0115147590 /NCGR_PEP_ID=MMETSP0227-20121206/63399_1 /TAXON_ID=89957 /ORGANISM="Polarella glacialis, Strain CCMP 1383" /LENGTH=31 /DNA_ID= /DNA_START= /DNA_END= /DNA_ORIENTATION=